MVCKLELGQMLLSNTPIQSYESYWATDGLNMIAEVIAELRGKQHGTYGWDGLLTSNSGAEDYINDVFEMRSYCWCDATWEEDPEHPHAHGCPPNFLYKPTGMIITWYKHANRGATSNKQYPGARTWFEIIKHCIGSIE
jgi:hypothetical protein